MARRDAPPTTCCVRFEPQNPRQAEALALYPDSPVLFLVGGAGVGKTITAAYLAARDVQEGRRKRIVFLRPAVESGPSLGHLPGTLAEKLEPYTAPFKQALGKVAFRFPPERVAYDAVGFARGLTYDDCVVVVDEAQNLHLPQLKLLLTRLGRNCRMVVLADPDQSDVRPGVPGYGCDLDAVLDALEGLKGVGVVEFTEGDVVRHPLIAPMLRRLRRYDRDQG